MGGVLGTGTEIVCVPANVGVNAISVAWCLEVVELAVVESCLEGKGIADTCLTDSVDSLLAKLPVDLRLEFSDTPANNVGTTVAFEWESIP